MRKRIRKIGDWKCDFKDREEMAQWYRTRKENSFKKLGVSLK